MTYIEFMTLAHKEGIFRAMWIAKYLGVAEITVKSFVRAAMAVKNKA